MAGPDGVSRVVHHNKYYLRGGDMTVIVENHLYRIHSYFFVRESLFFRQKFNISDGEERGFTDQDAYTLEDVKSEDFARFLWVFYNERYSIYEAPLETWLSILRLANRWGFDNVKELSVRELEKIDIESVEKITIYHDNNISRLYLLPSYISVCKRDKPLTFTEGMKLGMETVLRIAEARERLRLQASESGVRTPTFEDFEDAEVEILVRDIFRLGTRPTSPASVTPPNGASSTTNGTIKLNPAPPGNPPKANGAPAPRANGGSAADPRASSVNSMPSIASVISPQGPAMPPAPATPPPTTQTTRATAPPQEPRLQAALARVAQTATSSPHQPPTPPTPSDKPKGKETAIQETNNLSSLLSPGSGGVGEPSSPGIYSQGAGSRDDTISEPVVAKSEDSNDLIADSTDNVNNEKDESGKDVDLASVMSDTEVGKGRGTGKSRKTTKQGGTARSGKKNN